MKQKIAIRCITETAKGYGNLYRSITLSESLRKKGHDILFIITKNQKASKELKTRNFSFTTIPHFRSKVKECKKISKLLILRKVQTIVIDMREYSEKMSRELKKNDLRVILLDDAWCKNAYADLIFNGTFIKKFLHYKKINTDVKLFLGSKYFIADEQFLKHRKKINEIYDKMKYHVVISIGGSDPRNLSSLILKSISSLPKIDITIVCGPFFKQRSKITKISKQTKNITIISSPKNIWKIFQKADVVISNAGNTLFELSIMRIPTLCIPMIKHQEPYVKEFISRGFAISLGKPSILNQGIIQNKLKNVLNDKQLRKNMYLAASEIMDGKGLSRVVLQITKFLKTS